MTSFFARLFLPQLLDRYIFKQLLDYFILGVVVFSLVAFFSDALFDFINDIQKYGIPLSMLLTVVGLQMPKSVSLVIPASCFLAVLMVYNTLNNNFELISIRMNGISLVRLIRPALLMGLVASMITYVINDYVVPFCNGQTEAIKRQAMENAQLPEGQKSFLYKAYDDNHNLLQLIYVSNYQGRKLGDSTIIDLSSNVGMKIVQAKSGLYNPAEGWNFQDANVYVVAKETKSSSAGHWGEFRVQNLLNKDRDLEKQREEAETRAEGIHIDSDTQSFSTLMSIIHKREALMAQFGDKYEVARKSYLNMWEKITLPLSCLLIILSAVALAISAPREGSQRGFIMALLVLFSYYVVRSICFAMGRSDFFEFGGLIPRNYSLMLAAWLPLLLIGLVGFFLLGRKSRVLS